MTLSSPRAFVKLASARIAIAVRVACTVVVALVLLAGCARAAPDVDLDGVRLGMSPRDVRDRFEGGKAGTWQSKVGGGTTAEGDTVLEWTSTEQGSRAAHARFEFHLGMLVAIRAHLRQSTPTERVDLTPRTVTLRAPAAQGTDVTVLARDCPTHRDEAASLAARPSAARASN